MMVSRGSRQSPDGCLSRPLQCPIPPLHPPWGENSSPQSFGQLDHLCHFVRFALLAPPPPEAGSGYALQGHASRSFIRYVSLVGAAPLSLHSALCFYCGVCVHMFEVKNEAAMDVSNTIFSLRYFLASLSASIRPPPHSGSATKRKNGCLALANSLRLRLASRGRCAHGLRPSKRCSEFTLLRSRRPTPCK